MVELNQNFRRYLHKYKAAIKNCKKFPRGVKKLASYCPGVTFATPCHFMAMGLNIKHSDRVAQMKVHAPYMSLRVYSKKDIWNCNIAFGDNKKQFGLSNSSLWPVQYLLTCIENLNVLILQLLPEIKLKHLLPCL